MTMSASGKGMDPHRSQGSPVDAPHRKPPPQKAWTHGTNPITHPSSTPPPVTANGALPVPRPAPTATFTETPTPMRHLNDRMMYLLANLMGLPGTITLKNGEKYSGVLSGHSLDPTELRYVFKMVKKLVPPAHAHANGTGEPDGYVGAGDTHVMSFDMADVADFNVNNVVLDRSQTKGQNGTASFRTDTDISGHMAVRERNLQKWQPADVDTSLALESSGRANDWDQFATNERMFGLKSNYDETLYTTTINKNDPQYAQRAARAEKIAREIESSSALNAHVREERGGPNSTSAHDAGGDEEDKYSGVRRDLPALATGQANRYTPPARRAPTAQATVPGAPVDPAIISAIPRPDSKSAQPNASPATTSATPGSSAKLPESAVSPPVPSSSSTTTTTKATTTTDDAKKKSMSKPAGQVQKPITTTTKSSVVAAIPPRRTGRPNDATTNVEHDLLDSFKQFSAAEKLRISDRQRAFARENKAVKINDLKKFALNFKLSTPVPSDLVPILAKDETKQQAIVEKALKQAQEIKAAPSKTSNSLADPKAATRSSTKPEQAHASPSTNMDRQSTQRSRPGQTGYTSASLRDRTHHQNMNQIPPRNNQGLGARLQLSQHQHKQHQQQGTMSYNNIPQPIPTQDMRLPPTGPSQPSSGVQSPGSGLSSRFNVRANEFKPNPAAHTFQPSGNPSENSSPRPNSAVKQEIRRSWTITSFFGNQKKPTIKSLDEKTTFNAIGRMEKEADKSHHAGSIPPPYKTPPTWDFPAVNTEKGHIQLFEHAAASAPLTAPHSAMAGGSMPHQHQLPPHLQGAQGMPQTQHTARGLPVQSHPPGQGPNQHHYEAQHMQFSHSTSSVHPSPRPMQPYIYGTQPQQMPSGYPQSGQVPQYGMSPGLQHVTLRNAQGGQFVSPPGPAMGGHMMTNQPSNGPYMQMPGNPQMPIYSPAPGPAYPQYPGHMPGPPGANGFPSPRPGAQMMSHQGSQQGHHQQPSLMYMQPGAPGPQMYPIQPGSMTPMRGPYAQLHQGHYGSPQQHQQFPQQHRGTPSGSYSQPMLSQHSMGAPVPPAAPVNHGPESNDEPK